MKLTNHERNVLARLAACLKADFGAERIVLYGSAAKGEMDDESDIDLLVTLPTVNWDIEKRIGDLAFDAGLEISRIISTMCFSKSDLTDGPMRSSPLVLNVNREGTLL